MKNRRKRLRPLVSTRLHLEQLEPRLPLSAAGLAAISGDWDRDGTDTAGMYDPQQGQFYLRNENTPGFSNTRFKVAGFGPQALPVAGDWDGNGSDTVGLYDPKTGDFTLWNKNRSDATPVTVHGGAAMKNGLPVAGDWNGDGKDTVGVYRPSTRQVVVRHSLAAGAVDQVVAFWPASPPPIVADTAASAWRPLAGDWDGDGRDGIGLYNNVKDKIFLKNDLTGAVDEVFYLGQSRVMEQPVAGDWDADGDDSMGIYNTQNGVWSLKDDLGGGTANHVFYVVPAKNTVREVDTTPVTGSGATGSSGNAAAAQNALPADPFLTEAEVEQLLNRAAAASASDDGIFAVVDRGGRILGVRVEAGVPITANGRMVFAIDGAVAKARTAAFFSNGEAPLTSRTVRFISQTTITEREVNSNPNDRDPNSTTRGPGFVAPIGLGGHFPPEILHTPPVDLFAIEHTNRDGSVHPGPDRIKGTADDIPLPSRFNVDPAFIPAGGAMAPPDSYGFTSGRLPRAQSRGIGTLPGGIPLYKDTNDDGVVDVLVGGIGVFFPGPRGFASFEQGFIPGIGQTEFERTNADRVLESEWIAFAAAGGSAGFGASVGTLNGIAPVAGFDLPAGRIDLVGITLEIYGPHPQGHLILLDVGREVGRGNPFSGANQTIDPGPDGDPDTLGDNLFVIPGAPVPEGWLVLPHAGTGLTANDVTTIITQGINEANLVRAAIRLPPGRRTKMNFAVSDLNGNLLGVFRMPDTTVFSIDVSVAKARNTAYYNDPTAILPIDQVDDNDDGVPDLPRGVAFTNRTFRFLAEPRFPSGVEASKPGDFSMLRDPGINPLTAENTGATLPASVYDSVKGFDAFNPGTNFRDPLNIANQNGIVFFPGSTSLYKNQIIVGGFGVSGDGVDQDDVVTFSGAIGFQVPDPLLRADEVFVRGVRLPFQKFLRNPRG